VNRDDGVLAIVLAAEHLLDLAAFDEAGKLLDARGELRGDIFALARPVDEHTKVVCLGSERRDQLDLFLDSTAALKDFLRLDLVGPEIGRGCAGFYLCEFITRASGFKDNSGGRQPASQVQSASGQIIEGDGHECASPSTLLRIAPSAVEGKKQRARCAANTYANRSPVLPDRPALEQARAGELPSEDFRFCITRPHGSTNPVMPV
jgi:hypothetical protein